MTRVTLVAGLVAVVVSMVGVVGAPAQAVPATELRVGDVAVPEGDGTQNGVPKLALRLSDPLAAAHCVYFHTEDGTATGVPKATVHDASHDYVSRTASAKIAANKVVGAISTTVLYDTVSEPGETYDVVVDTVTTAAGTTCPKVPGSADPAVTVVDDTGTVTIQDDDAAPTWTSTGSLANTRTQHTATLLPNGKVLVAGGAGNTCRQVAELYDPATGTWADTGTMVTNHSGHTATLLLNGKVLVAGGDDCSGVTDSSELYDPATGTWASTGTMTKARTQHSATRLPNGKVLVTNGTGPSAGGGAIPSAELYDPATGTWATAGPMAYNHGGNHTATLLLNGKVLVAGGATSGTELYDPATDTWAPTGSLSGSREQTTATLLPNGKVLIAAGYNGGLMNSAELYDPATGLWAPTGSMTDSRLEHSATLLPSGKVLVAGGWDGAAFSARSSAELYDPATGTWATADSMIGGRQSHTATLLPSGKVLVAGGNVWSFPLSSAELYG